MVECQSSYDAMNSELGGEPQPRKDWDGMLVQSVSVQGSSTWNEDALIQNEALHIYGVADGATSLVPYHGPQGETGGRMASQLLKRYFGQLTAGDERNLLQMTCEANRLLGAEMQAADVPLETKEQLWTTGVAAVRVTEHTVEYVQSGDCMILALYEDDLVRVLTRDHVVHMDEGAKQLWREAIREGVRTREELWERVRHRMTGNRASMNTRDGYAVLNGRPEAEHFMEYGIINRIRLKGLLLHTDGLYVPSSFNSGDDSQTTAEAGAEKPDVGEETLLKQMIEKGLEAYTHWLVAEEQRDPECVRYPRFKMSDDKTAMWLDFT